TRATAAAPRTPRRRPASPSAAGPAATARAAWCGRPGQPSPCSHDQAALPGRNHGNSAVQAVVSAAPGGALPPSARRPAPADPPGLCQAWHMPAPAAPLKITNVAVPIADGVAPFELGIACELFGLDRSDQGLPRYDFALASVPGGPVL